MSDNGDLITYQGLGPPGTNGMAYVYSAPTGQDSQAFAAKICTYLGILYPCYSYSAPVMSGDGSAVAAVKSNTLVPTYPALIVARTRAAGGYAVVAADTGAAAYVPLALNHNGSVLVYGVFNPTDAYAPAQLGIYRNGTLENAPELSDTSLASASISSDGTLVVYTLLGTNFAGRYFDYPGVYAWQP